MSVCGGLGPYKDATLDNSKGTKPSWSKARTLRQ